MEEGAASQPPQRPPGSLSSRRASVSKLGPIEDSDYTELYPTKACLCLKSDDGFRKNMIKLHNSKTFSGFTIFLILSNCFFICLSSPLDVDPESPMKTMLNSVEWVYTILFTLEMLVHIFALGFFADEGSYLRDAWNWLDFIVVAISWVSILGIGGNLSALRTFRVLRPLRTLNAIPELKIIVTSLLKSASKMVDVGILALFIFLLFGIIGVQLWTGLLQMRCAVPSVDDLKNMQVTAGANQSALQAAVLDKVRSEFGINQDQSPVLDPTLEVAADGANKGSRLVSDDIMCRCDETVVFSDGRNECEVEGFKATLASGDTCAEALGDYLLQDLADVNLANSFASAGITGIVPFRCTRYENPGYGFIGFDNIGMAMLTIFTSITLEGWVDVMYSLNATFGAPVPLAIYFALLTITGAYILLNLALAVIIEQYEAAQEEREAEEEAERALAERNAEQVEGDADGGAGKPIEPAAKDHWQQPSWMNLLDNTITVFIIANTVVMSMEAYSKPSESAQNTRDTLCYMNLVFSAVFFVEMIIKLVVLGPKRYAEDGMNLFDGLVVTISVVEVVVELALLGALCTGAKTGLGALRTFRLMRMFKLARSWKELNKLILVIMKSVGAAVYALVVTILIMFIFALLGLNIFGGQFGCIETDAGVKLFQPSHWRFPGGVLGSDSVPPTHNPCLGDSAAGSFDERPRAHFDTLWWSIVSVFQVLTGENWNDLVVISMNAHSWFVGSLYFCILTLVGNFMILNLFLAILIGNMEAAREESNAEAESVQDEGSTPKEPSASSQGAASAAVAPMGEDTAALAEQLAEKEEAKKDVESYYPLEGVSMCGFSASGKIRKTCAAIVSWPAFDNVIILSLILISTVLLIIDSPSATVCKNMPETAAGSCKGLGTILTVSDILLNVLFTIEMLLKMITMGFVFGPRTYMNHPAKKGWNRLDFFVVMISWVALLAESVPWLKSLRSMRALRALRPLRVLSKSDGMKLVINSVFKSFPGVAKVLSVATLFFLIFAIVGVQNFAGKMSSCSDPRSLCPPRDLVCVGGDCSGNTLALPPTLAKKNGWLVHPKFLGGKNEGGDNEYDNFDAVWKGDETMAVDGKNPAYTFQHEGKSSYTCADVYLNTTAYWENKADEDFEVCDESTTFTVFDAGLCSLAKNSKLQYECEQAQLHDVRWSITQQRKWDVHSGYSYQTVGAGLTTLYEVASGEMWPDIMYDTVDGAEVDAPMQMDFNPSAALYYMAVTVVCAFVMMELFTGEVIDKYNEMKEENEGSALLTSAQQATLAQLKAAMRSQPRRQRIRPGGAVGGFCYDIVEGKGRPNFDSFIMTLIILNVVCLAAKYDGQSESFSEIIDLFNILFNSAFTVEMLMKHFALGWKDYWNFGKGWSFNRFDGVLVILSWLGVVFKLGPIMSIFRALRMVRLVNKIKGLMQLIETLMYSASAVYNVGVVLMLCYLVFAIFGVTLFAKVKHGELLNGDANFESFDLAFITLYRMSTGESFNGIMHDQRVAEPFCDPTFKCMEWCGVGDVGGSVVDGKCVGGDVEKMHDLDQWCGNFEETYSNCGAGTTAVLYHVLFFTISAYMLLNLIVAIVLDNFSEAGDTDDIVVSQENIENFRAEWVKLDPDADERIPIGDLQTLILRVECPLGLKGSTDDGDSKHKTARKMTKEGPLSKLKSVGGQVSYQDTLQALVMNATKTDDFDPEELMSLPGVKVVNDLADKVEKKKQKFQRQMSKQGLGTPVSSEEYSAAQEIQAAFRGKQARKIVRASTGSAAAVAPAPTSTGDGPPLDES
jgi:hypothetical protein